MKRLGLILCILLGSLFASSQGFQATTYYEQTHVSPKVGSALSYELAGDYGFEIGGFYQKSTIDLEAEPGRPLRSEEEFYGAFFAYPIMDDRLVNLKVNIRTGVSNGENFVITPSLLADFQPLRTINIGGGIGTRSFRPTFLASIKINLNSGPKGGGLIAMNNQN